MINQPSRVRQLPLALSMGTHEPNGKKSDPVLVGQSLLCLAHLVKSLLANETSQLGIILLFGCVI